MTDTKIEIAPSGGVNHVDAWIFDLDNTLYRTTPGMLAQIDDLMGSFIADFLKVVKLEKQLMVCVGLSTAFNGISCMIVSQDNNDV